jgi:hypothetical protein
VNGRGLRHRKADAKQRAVFAAAWLLGELHVTPSQALALQIFGPSRPYLRLALLLSAAERAAIIRGKDSAAFRALIASEVKPLGRPKPAEVDDAALRELVRIAGVDRVLDAAAAVESVRHAA